MSAMSGDFVAIDWDARLDVNAHLEAMSPNGTIKGMFPAGVVEACRLRGRTIADARERYLPFQDYPLREWVLILAGAAPILFPRVSIRMALRKLGRGTYDAYVKSMVGKITFGMSADFASALTATAKSYAIVLPPSRVEILSIEPSRATLRFTDVANFLDSHHVGVLEGIGHAFATRIDVKVRLESISSGEFLLTW